MTHVFWFSKFSHIYQDGWGLKGNEGLFYHNAKVIKKASWTFHNGVTVGLLLNMDNFTLEYYIKGEKVLTVSDDWRVFL
jgi:hypothetical protein